MINSIGVSGGSLVDAARQQATQRSDAVARPADGASREDIGAVSTTVSQLAAGGPPVDGSRVDALRAAIQSGSYKIDPQAIAGKMVDTDLGASL